MPESHSQRNPIDILSEEFLTRYRAGEAPRVEDYISRHPELADEIRELFPLLLEMEEVRPGDEASGNDHASKMVKATLSEGQY